MRAALVTIVTPFTQLAVKVVSDATTAAPIRDGHALLRWPAAQFTLKVLWPRLSDDGLCESWRRE